MTAGAPRDLEAALEALEAGTLAWVAVSAEGRVRSGDVWAGLALLSGAFNPLHAGHRKLAEAAARWLGTPVLFELPLVNADKAPLAAAEAAGRAAQFAGWATLLFTRAPLFSQKATLFPRSVFVVGADTAARLVAPRFYRDEPLPSVLAALEAAGCRFLVAGRQWGGRYLTLDDLPLPEAHRDLFTSLPESSFRLDVSSSALRGEGGAGREG